MHKIIFSNGTVLETDDAQAAAEVLREDRLGRVYTVAELAERLRIGTPAAYDLIRDGLIHYTCCGGAKNYRTTERDVLEMLTKPEAATRKNLRRAA